jgi:hypothetical protein
LNADLLDGVSANSTSGDRWTKIPVVGADGVMEVGRYIDFHSTAADATDFTYRIDNVSDGNLSFSGSLSVTGVITCTDLNTTSDIILKQNIQTVENALDIVNDLRGVKFEWKENNKPSFGVVAQELQEVLPELVTNTDPKTVNYNGIIGVLIEAIKEQQRQIEDLRARIDKINI